MEKVRIDRKKNEVVLTFNKSFYKQEHIRQAMKDFTNACEPSERQDSIILRPKKGIDIDKLGYEFYNYVLSLIKNS